MKSPLRILHLEDDVMDTDLLRALLEMDKIVAEVERVETREQFLRALEAGGYDLVISDYSLPSFDGLTALSLARELMPSVPFILFSGTIGEEAAIESLRNGATDYVLKQRPERLVTSMRRALREFEDRRRRQQAEEALREREEFFRLISENVTDLIAVVDLDGRRVYNSPSYEALLGDPAKLLGTDSFEEIHPEDRERIRRVFREMVASGVGQRAEFRFLLKDGTVRYIESQVSAMRDRNGKVTNVIVVSRDVTERKNAEEQIREQAALLDKAQDAICVTDMEQRILYWNRSAEALYGWTAAESLGKYTNELLFKNDSSRQMEALKSLISKREWKGELHQVTKHGTEIIVESRWTLVHDNEGRPKAILVIDTDITEKKKLEAQFFRSQRLENIGMLASGIAHDLNNVLAPIMMAVPMLRENVIEPADRNMLDMLDRSARRGAELVQQILSFARGVEGEHKLMQLRHLLADLEKMIRETFPKSIQLQKNIDPDLRPIHGNPTQIHQVLLNLCVNARDAMPNGGTLAILAENARFEEPQVRRHAGVKAGPFVVLMVVDTGSGIPSELLERIFEPFFTTKEPGKGTGLGLATVRGILKNHGGFVEVKSEVGKGTSFRICLPAAEPQSSQTTFTKQAELPVGHGELVLVVDDEEAIQQIARATLENFGYRVISANNGAEALAVYKQHGNEVKAVILDSMMPFMDGAATIRALREIAPRLRIVGVSGLSVDDEISTGAGGVQAFLTKPYTAQDLLLKLHVVLQTE
ncbi:MAG: hybrid sensor histidine kinase/response regulator [Verrucomicrobia bacterium]|nr:MAG: hybrid sensor histidine kinase/response regulator [Verrucomicrobiota bacterium]